MSSNDNTVQQAVPQELIESIIDFLVGGIAPNAPDFEGSFSALLACSLVSSAFLTRSRVYIFREVQLGQSRRLYDFPRPQSNKPEALLYLLEEGRGSLRFGNGIGEHIQVLRIHSHFNPLVPQIIALLPNLNALLIRTNIRSPLDQEYQILHQQGFSVYNNRDLTKSVDEIFRETESYSISRSKERQRYSNNLALKRLYIRQSFHADSMVTFNYLAKCLQLQHESSNVENASTSLATSPPSSPNSVTVRRLEIHNAFRVIELMLDFEHTRGVFMKLEDLLITLAKEDDIKVPWRLMCFVKETLMTLEMNFNNYARVETVPLIINLSHLPCLKKLIFVNYPLSEGQQNFSFPSGINTIFKRAVDDTSMNPLSIESIHVVLTRTWKSCDVQTQWDDDHWQELRRLINSGEGRFRNLKTFKVVISVSYKETMTPKDLSESRQTIRMEKARPLIDFGHRINSVFVFC